MFVYYLLFSLHWITIVTIFSITREENQKLQVYS